MAFDRHEKIIRNSSNQTLPLYYERFLMGVKRRSYEQFRYLILPIIRENQLFTGTKKRAIRRINDYYSINLTIIHGRIPTA